MTPEIQALARGLENDPLRIFNYVHDHIRHVLYFGSKKGAQLTLLERSGNDFDQSALLVALLQAAGYTNTGYQFGLLQMPYDSADHNDLHHWLGLTLVNTNWSNTTEYFSWLLGTRGYPFYLDVDQTNTLAFHRVWVTLTIGTNTYYLDPAFKVSEPVTGINLPSAMGLSTNDLLTAAGGTATTDYVQSLNEGALRNKLRDYTTNLVNFIQTNCPNASVEQVLGGQQVTTWTNGLSQSRLFPTDDYGGQMPVVNWTSEPTNLMASLTISLASTNYQWFIPALQGQRLSLTFDSSGLAQLWQDDTLLLQTSTSGGGSISVTLSINHPFGTWDTTSNSLIDNGKYDATVAANYQRTNATYALMYAFEPDAKWLRERQEQLDAYRQQGLADSSRQVVSETLNVMGLGWMLQSDRAEQTLSVQSGILNQYHHRLGRMAQEGSHGYYIDVYMQLDGLFMDNGVATQDWHRLDKTFDLSSYFSSAMEHGIIEQLQSSGLVAASTVKMLELASTNSLKIYLASSANWTTGANVRSQLVNYDLSYLDSFINAGDQLFLPQDGSRYVAGTGSWKGYGLVARYVNGSFGSILMLIKGAYLGGWASTPGATVSPPVVSTASSLDPVYFAPQSPFVPSITGADPVNMADGAFHIDATDLSLGQAEPRGLTLTRFYSPTRRHHNLAGLAHGWINNYYFNLAETSAPEPGLGATTPAQMAPALVATGAALNLYNESGNPKNWAVTALIAKWEIDQLVNNAVSVTLGNNTLQFVKQPDGSFTPPANCTMTLTKPGSTYVLQERHGNTFNFDTNKRLSSIVDQYGKSLALTYNSSNWVYTATDWKNRSLTFNYTGSPLHLTSVSDSTGRSVSYGYTANPAGQLDLTSVTDPETKTSTYQYDTNHQVLATKDALNQLVVTNIYDGFGRVMTQYTQGDTNKTWQVYWSDWATVEQDPAGSRRRFFFDDKHRLIAQQDALGNLSQTFYDGQDHAVMTISPLNETNRFVYDGNHNLTNSTDPLGYTNQFFYNTQNNLTRTVDARGNTNLFGYNAKFQLIGSTNAMGNWVTNFYSATDGTLSTRTDPGGTTSYGYDSYGQLNLITYPGSLGSEGLLNNALATC